MKDKISPHQGVLEVSDLGFFQEIQGLEALLEFDITLEIINNLIQLYTQAIEHFESFHDPQYAVYAQKMQRLLRREDVMRVLATPTDPVPLPKPPRKELSCERIIEKTFQALKTDNSLVLEKIQENLKQQNEKFYSKLLSRKKKTKQKAKFLAFEQGVEEIMEEFVKIKGKCINEVQEKYSDSLKELKNMKQNEVVKSVVQEIEKRMNKEVEEKVEEIENCKKKQIQKLKSVVQLQIG